jgi:hypothetical protein
LIPLVTFHVHSIMRSSFSQLRAIEALAIKIVLGAVKRSQRQSTPG